jgi:ATP-binding cassette subfamily F protein uup
LRVHSTRGFASFEAWRDEVLEQEELERHKLDRKIAREERLAALRRESPGAASATCAALGELHAICATERKDARGPVRAMSASPSSEGGTSGKLVIEAEHICQGV